MFNIGFGSQDFSTDNPSSALTLGGGYRAGILGVAGEAQFIQGEEDMSLSALRAQLRLYLPVGGCTDIYPLVGLSHFSGDREGTQAVDVGFGADFTLGGRLSLGGRYNHSFFTHQIRDVNNREVSSSGTFLVQIGI
jgi:hypothetical protein